MEGSPNESMEALMTAIQSIEEKDKNFEIRKSDRKRRFVEIFSYTARCNWLDVVDITFTENAGMHMLGICMCWSH